MTWQQLPQRPQRIRRRWRKILGRIAAWIDGLRDGLKPARHQRIQIKEDWCS